jgi:hypothetical protein
MLQTIQNAFKPSGHKSLAASFARLGWIGLWMQVVIGSIPLLLALYAFLFDGNRGAGTRGGLALIEYMTLASLMLLVFTTIWFFRYVRLAKRIADPSRRPQNLDVQRVAWTGVAASTLGIVLSMLIMLFEVVQLLFYFLRAPQAGIPVVQTTGGGPASWVSAADVVNLLALSFVILVEVIALAFSLWLLFRSMVASKEYPDAGGTAAEA